uniref:Bifunctional epoxide hydrolase 2-like n=1 Tax=Castor canadensis TaxID=51338 RepID=A0A8B7U7F9_CASCN
GLPGAGEWPLATEGLNQASHPYTSPEDEMILQGQLPCVPKPPQRLPALHSILLSKVGGPLNWYRNMERNWKWSCRSIGRKILIPALMVTAEKDVVLTPEMSKHMENWIPHLKRGHINDCGHWTQMEKPTEVNQILIDWLETEVKNRPVSKI